MVRQVGGAPAATRRPRVPRWFTIGLAMGVIAVSYLGLAASGQTDEDTLLAHAPAGQADVEGPRRAVADRADRADRVVPKGTQAVQRGAGETGGQAFATVEDVVLALPHSDPVKVAFHEASRPDALELTPLGRLEGNDNTTKFTGPADGDGPPYHVLSSRGRARPATSAVDVVVPAGGVARAPVSGRVVEIREYLLYGSLRDWRVVIEPDARSDLHVVLIHLHEPAVEVGDEVRAGTTPLAVVRQLPFTSHVDYVVGAERPHVHVEVRPATAPKPHDPNEPAIDASQRLDGLG